MEFYRLIDSTNRHLWEWDQPIALTPLVRNDASWIIKNLPSHNGRAAWKPSHIKTVYVDASLTGWGGRYAQHIASGRWKTPQSHRQICQLEALAALHSLQAFGTLLAHSTVTIFIDNRGAQTVIAKGGSLPWQCECLRNLWQICEHFDINIHEIQWIPSSLNPEDPLHEKPILPTGNCPTRVSSFWNSNGGHTR